MQLINPAIYEKQSQERARAIEETRKLRVKQKDDREKLKLSKHLERLDGNTITPNYRASHVPQNYEITVQGIRFQVMKDGSKLMRLPGDENAAKMTPKLATVGGVRFYRSKNGNLYRSGIVKAQRYDLPDDTHCSSTRRAKLIQLKTRRTGVVKKIDEPCRIFSTTGTFLLPAYLPEHLHRMVMVGPRNHTDTFLGICPKGPRCRYIHDPTKVAVCKEFLLKGTCTAGDSCDVSHDLTPERTPACMHFSRGNCSNANCRYSHVRVSPSALVCRPFATYGYCEKGAACTERHVHECPDFSNTGTCDTKGCKLPHRLKASMLRKNAARGEEAEDGSSDLSSDDDAAEIDSDDVDSDDLEILGQDDGEDSDIPMQQDYVQL